MQQLLYQSESHGLIHESDDLRALREAWRRFWFNDQPSRLLPERIHGGIQ